MKLTRLLAVAGLSVLLFEAAAGAQSLG